jgi:cytidylate kinase
MLIKKNLLIHFFVLLATILTSFVMHDFLTEYFEKRYQQQEDTPQSLQKSFGPVLTISRECGCEGTLLSKQLAYRLNEYYLPIGARDNWKVISKEVLESSARNLKTNSESIKFVFKSESKSVLEDFVESMASKQYHSESKIKNAIKKVIKDFANQGYSIILGRAGAQLTRYIDNSLHIKLVAPFDWRVSHIMRKLELSRAAAINLIRTVDANREKIIKKFHFGGKAELSYDVTYNLEKIAKEQLISDILHIMEQKKLI